MEKEKKMKITVNFEGFGDLDRFCEQWERRNRGQQRGELIIDNRWLEDEDPFDCEYFYKYDEDPVTAAQREEWGLQKGNA